MWCVYGYSQFSCEIRAVLDGLRYLGWPVAERNHNGWTGDDQREDFSPVFVSGLRDKGEKIRAAYNAIGVPCFVIDYGYIRRVSGVATMAENYWQVGINRLGWVPPFACPPDRFDRLEIEIRAQSKRGDRIYVCGQHVGDPSHGLDKAGIERWARGMFENLRMVTDRPIVWKPHPDSHFDIDGAETCNGPIEWDDARAIICINSNIGHEALIEGVPVISATNAPYAELACDAFSESIRVPSVRMRAKYFHRLAYAQWTLDEVRRGLPMLWAEENGLTKRNIT